MQRISTLIQSILSTTVPPAKPLRARMLLFKSLKDVFATDPPEYQRRLSFLQTGDRISGPRHHSSFRTGPWRRH